MTADQKLAWLAGFFDREGTICFGIEKKNGIIHPRADLSNTNRLNADFVKTIYSDILGREFRWVVRKNGEYRPIFNIRVKNLGEIKKLLEALLPYLVGKKPQAILMLEYLSVAPGRGSRFQPFHYEFVAKMKNMNRRYSKGEWQSKQENELVAPHKGEETFRSSQRCEESDGNAQTTENQSV